MVKAMDCGIVVSEFELQSRYYVHNNGLNSLKKGSARGVMVVVVGNGQGDISSNRGRDWLHFTNTLGEKYESNYSPSSYG